MYIKIEFLNYDMGNEENINVLNSFSLLLVLVK